MDDTGSFIDDDSGKEEDDGEEMTAAEVLEKLQEAWCNEKFAPELLENKVEIVECIMDQIQEMEDNIGRARAGDFKVSVHRMEIDRIRFVLSSYLRARLRKIEKFTAQILEEEAESAKSKLSAEELVFAKEYQANLEAHLKTLALQNMPPNLQNLDSSKTAVRPNLDSYVFLRVNENVEGVMVEEETAEDREEVIDFEKDDQHIMRYRPIGGLVTAASVSLI